MHPVSSVWLKKMEPVHLVQLSFFEKTRVVLILHFDRGTKSTYVASPASICESATFEFH